jgi:ABC-type tungstate transport system substrate-binding protein
MDEIALTIGYMVIGLSGLIAFFYLVSRYPGLWKIVTVFSLLTWGAAGLVGVPLVAYFIHFRNGNYAVAIGTVVVGAVLYVPWLVFGLPALLSHLGLNKPVEP